MNHKHVPFMLQSSGSFHPNAAGPVNLKGIDGCTSSQQLYQICHRWLEECHIATYASLVETVVAEEADPMISSVRCVVAGVFWVVDAMITAIQASDRTGDGLSICKSAAGHLVIYDGIHPREVFQIVYNGSALVEKSRSVGIQYPPRRKDNNYGPTCSRRKEANP